MGVTPATYSPSAPSPAAAPTSDQQQQKRRFTFDQRYVAPLLVSAILVFGHLTQGILESPARTGLAIIVSILAEIVLGLIVYKKIPHLASAYVSGISVGILVRSPEYWPYAMGALISILSKYVIRMDNRHLWNPSNFAISCLLFLAPLTVASLSVQWGNAIWAALVIWTLGSVIIWRLKRFHICAVYVVSFLGYGVLRHFITGHALEAEIAPITGPMYQLFIFFMITDPKTTVTGRRAQMLVAFLVATAENFLRLAGNVHAPYYALFLVGPVANFVEIMMVRRRAAKAVTPGIASPATAH